MGQRIAQYCRSDAPACWDRSPEKHALASVPGNSIKLNLLNLKQTRIDPNIEFSRADDLNICLQVIKKTNPSCPNKYKKLGKQGAGQQILKKTAPSLGNQSPGAPSTQTFGNNQ